MSGTKIAEYYAVDGAIAELKGQYEGRVYDVTTADGLKECRAARAVIRRYRTDLEATRKRIKAPFIEGGKLVDSEANRITVDLRLLEDPFDEQIKGEERRKAEEKAERGRIERDRITAIKGRIASMNDLLVQSVGASAADIVRKRDRLHGEIVDASYEELETLATTVKAEVMDRLQGMIDTKAEAEERERKIKEDREKLDKEQAEFKRKQDELAAMNPEPAEVEPESLDFGMSEAVMERFSPPAVPDYTESNEAEARNAPVRVMQIIDGPVQFLVDEDCTAIIVNGMHDSLGKSLTVLEINETPDGHIAVIIGASI